MLRFYVLYCLASVAFLGLHLLGRGKRRINLAKTNGECYEFWREDNLLYLLEVGWYDLSDWIDWGLFKRREARRVARKKTELARLRKHLKEVRQARRETPKEEVCVPLVVAVSLAVGAWILTIGALIVGVFLEDHQAPLVLACYSMLAGMIFNVVALAVDDKRERIEKARRYAESRRHEDEAPEEEEPVIEECKSNDSDSTVDAELRVVRNRNRKKKKRRK